MFVEAESRGYAFNRGKVGRVRTAQRIESTAGQLDYEWRHLMGKLRKRSPSVYRKWRGVSSPDAHPLFRIKNGAIESWERPQGGG